jgi:hypothetical protein
MGRRPPLGETIVIETGQDRLHRWWWRGERDFISHGPFSSKKDADEDARITVLGPDCEVTEEGMWDPAWDTTQ